MINQEFVRGWAALALPLLCLSACGGAPVTSTRLAGRVDSPIDGGVAYYLPKGVLKLNVYWRGLGPEASAPDTSSDLASGAPPPAPKRRAPGEGPGRYFATIRELAFVPDRNYLMHLRTHPSGSYHDTISVDLTKEGLLQRVETLVVDESPRIVAKLAELGTILAGVPPVQKSAEGFAPEAPVLVRTLVVDPTDVRMCDEQLGRYRITLRAKPMVGGADACCTLEPGAPCEPVGTRSGVCYRPIIPFTVSISPGGLEPEFVNGQPVNPLLAQVTELHDGIEQIYVLPNLSPVVCMPIDRVPFVTSRFSAKFELGLLTQLESDTPSVILGFLSIPIDVAKAVVGIPAQLLQVKVNHYESQKRVMESKKALGGS